MQAPSLATGSTTTTVRREDRAYSHATLSPTVFGTHTPWRGDDGSVADSESETPL
jgi:hypothetical protein